LRGVEELYNSGYAGRLTWGEKVNSVLCQGNEGKERFWPVGGSFGKNAYLLAGGGKDTI